MDNLEGIKNDFLFSLDSKLIRISEYRIRNILKKDYLKFLLGLLRSRNPVFRNRAALALKRLRENRAVMPLIRAADNPKNRSYEGSFVYALESLDCSQFLLKIMQYVLYRDYEVQCHALNILKKQSFDSTGIEIEKAKKMLQDFAKKNKDKSLGALIEEVAQALRKIERRARRTIVKS